VFARFIAVTLVAYRDAPLIQDNNEKGEHKVRPYGCRPA
jgi:hypothetical protein